MQGNNNNLNPILLTGHYDVVPVDDESDLAWINSLLLESLMIIMFGVEGL